MARRFTWLSVLTGLALAACSSGGASPAEVATPNVTPAAVSCPAQGRPPMGFAYYPGRLMALASGRSRVAPYERIVAERADMLSFHWDNNVPWALIETCGSELDACAPPRALRTAHQRQQAFFDEALQTMARLNARRYVGINPLDIRRQGVSIAFERQQGVRSAQAPGTTFGDAAVRAAYLDFVRYSVGKFRPAYFSPGIEINMYAAERPEDFAKLLSLMAEARTMARSIDPGIVVAPSLQWEFFKRDWRNAQVRPQLEQLVASLPEIADALFISTYPTVLGAVRGVGAADYAFAEYGLPTTWPVLVAEAGTQPNLQPALIRILVELGQSHDLHGVIWFLAQDMDKLNIPIPGLRDIGLFDDSRRELRPHTGAAVWDGYLACPAAP